MIQNLIFYYKFQRFQFNKPHYHILSQQYTKNMKNNKWKHQRWHLLTENKPGQASQRQSISSKDSQLFTKFTPKKSTIISPQTKLNLVVLNKPVTTPLQHSSRILKLQGKQSKDSQNKSVVIEPISLKLLAKRANSQQADNSKILTKRSQIIPVNTLPLNLNNVGGGHITTDTKYQQLNNQHYFQNKLKKGQQSLRSQVLQSEENDQKINKNKWETIDRIKLEKNVQILFQKCVEFMDSMEKQMLKQRISVQKMLDDKYRDFVSMKQKIIKTFVLRQKQIKKHQLRKIIQQYLPKQQSQKNTLTRITSQKLFNRGGEHSLLKRDIFPRQFNFDLNLNNNNNMNNNNNHMYQAQKQKQSLNNMSANRRSVNSRDNSAFKSNFQTIFVAINKLKEQLSDHGNAGEIMSPQKIPSLNKRSTSKLSLYYEPQKSQKQSATSKNPKNTKNNKDNDVKNLPQLQLQSLKSHKKLRASMINNNSPLNKSGFIEELLNASSSKISNC